MKFKPHYGQGNDGCTFNPLTRSRECKHGEIFHLLGDLDELQSWIGLLRAKMKKRKRICSLLKEVQVCIYKVNSHITTRGKIDVTLKDIEKLEKEIDRMSRKCGELEGFILPSGSEAACIAHLTRAVCRRAERTLVEFREKNEWVNQNVIRFMNRLSDYLFVLARYINRMNGIKEEFARD